MKLRRKKPAVKCKKLPETDYKEMARQFSEQAKLKIAAMEAELRKLKGADKK